MKLVADGVERLLSASGELETIMGVFQSILGEMGLTHFLYAEMPSPIPSLDHGLVPFFLAQPASLLEHYLEAISLPEDPIALELPRRVTPFTVLEAIRAHVPVGRRAKVVGMLEELGLANGLVIPLNSQQGLHYCSTVFTSERGIEAAAVLARARHRAHVLAAYFHQRVREVLGQQMSTRHSLLTPRERECLLWAACGKTAWETSRILKIAERTVKFHLANASRRLDTANTTHAVARAILRGEFLL
jgi:DNA-binding CsgD family transcriptional regulator